MPAYMERLDDLISFQEIIGHLRSPAAAGTRAFLILNQADKVSPDDVPQRILDPLMAHLGIGSVTGTFGSCVVHSNLLHTCQQLHCHTHRGLSAQLPA